MTWKRRRDKFKNCLGLIIFVLQEEKIRRKIGKKLFFTGKTQIKKGIEKRP